MEEYLSLRQQRARAIPRSAILEMRPFHDFDGVLIEFKHLASTADRAPYEGWVEVQGGRTVGYSCTCPDAQDRGCKGEPCKHAAHVALEHAEPSVAVGIPVRLPAYSLRGA